MADANDILKMHTHYSIPALIAISKQLETLVSKSLLA